MISHSDFALCRRIHRMKLAQSIFMLALISGGCRPAESQSVLTLERKLPVNFAMLSNVVELRDGRIVFTDTKNKLFLRADLKSGKVDTLGARVDSLAQAGPMGQYKFPGWVAHLAGDTVALVDFSALRTTLWNEGGQPLGILRMRPVAGTAPVLVYDTLGRGYKIDYQTIIGGGEPGHTVRPDSIPVLRIHLPGETVDTVAALTSPEYGDAIFGEQVQQAAKVFAPQDFFGVLPDGTAWVARARENRVDWRSPDGRWIRGQPHPYTKTPVTQADRDRVLAQVREQGKQFGMPQDLHVVYPFADTKPPFDFALGRPNGEVWLQRPRTQEGTPLVYDVFDRQGVWQREIVFPKGAALAGFGFKESVYGSVKNGDGSRTVARFRVK
jgi:hypothetical protein